MSTTGKLSRENLRVRIVTLREQGLSLKDIEKKTGKHRFTISRICKSVQKTNSFKEKPRSGRPKLLDDRQKRILARILRSSKVKTAEHVRKEAKQFHNIDVSRDTVARALKSMGYVARVKKKKPMLSEKQRKARLEWARAHAKWTSDDWKHVIWSDEAPFMIVNSDGKEYVWEKPSQIISESSVKPTKKFGGGKVMMWGCITWEGVGFSCKIDETLDAELYAEILRGELKRTIDFYDFDISEVIFQADNDPKHTSHLAQDTLEELNIQVMSWPAQSPDLNPIEHFWEFVDRKLKGFEEMVASKEELWERIESIVQEINKDLCQKLIATMPERVIDVIRAKGGHTRW
jgi:transposase